MMTEIQCRALRALAMGAGCIPREFIRREFRRRAAGGTPTCLLSYATQEDALRAYEAAKVDMFKSAYGYVTPRTACVIIDEIAPIKPATLDIETTDAMEKMYNCRDTISGMTSVRMSASQPNLSTMPKSGTTAMNQTTIDHLKTQLAEAEAAKVKADAAAARDAKLAYYADLHAATGVLIAMLRQPNPTPNAKIVRFRKELAPLAAEFGAKIVLVGDRTQASVVSQ